MGERIRVVLVCDECGSRNYKTTKKAAGGAAERLKFKKFCAACNKHQLHQESK